MALTPNMSLDKPTPSVDAGPAWATRLNADLDLLDSHDHSTGKGIKITPAGLNVNSDLVLANTARLRQVGGLGLIAGGVVENNQLRTDGTELFYRDGVGNLVTLTSAGRPNTKFIGTGAGLYLNPLGSPRTVSSNTTLLDAGSEILIIYNVSGGAFTLTLPQLVNNNMRMYYLHEASGSANVLTVARNGTDKINNAAANLSLSTANKGTLLVADASTGTWWVFP